MYLIFDTETTGLPKNWRAPISDTDNWPRCVQLAWQVHDVIGNLIESKSYIVKPENFDIPFESEKIHGISTMLAEKEGVEPLIPQLGSIDDYGSELAEYIIWFCSDGVLHSDDEIFEAVFSKLPFSRRGARIVSRIEDEIKQLRALGRIN